MSNKNINIEENIILYENDFFLEKFMKENFGDNYDDILYIHGYDKIKKKYFKVYDYNTNIHIKNNNIRNLNNNDKNIIKILIN